MITGGLFPQRCTSLVIERTKFIHRQRETIPFRVRITIHFTGGDRYQLDFTLYPLPSIQAAVGGVTGGIRNHDEKAQRKEFETAFAACIEGRGYSVKSS